MRFNVISYLLKEGIRNVFKNKKSTISCLMIMCATMLIFGLFLVIGENINAFVKSVADAQGIMVYLKTGATDEEIEQILIAADHTAFTEQNPARTYQLPVMFRILFNCGLRTSELLKLRMRDVDLEENVFIILDTKFHKNRLVPFSTTVAEALKEYLEKIQEKSADAFIFPSSSSRSKSGRYGNSWIHAQFRQILRIAKIPYNGSGNGPRPHDIRHTFAVHCLNNWVLSGEDITAALPVLSRYLGHNGLSGTQKYLQLTAQMYPDIVTNLELQFGALIPQMEVANENI